MVWMQKTGGMQGSKAHAVTQISPSRAVCTTSQPAPDSRELPGATQHLRQREGFQVTASSLGTRLEHCGVLNIIVDEILIPLMAMPKLPLTSVEQLFFPSQCLSDQISVSCCRPFCFSEALPNVFRGN